MVEAVKLGEHVTTIAVCNVAFGAWHPQGQDRLDASLDAVGFKGSRLYWRDHLPAGCPAHERDAAPYAFKPWALRAAQVAGADIAIWVDASYWAVRPLDSLVAYTEEHGCWFHGPDHDAGMWTSDRCLAAFGRTRDQTMGVAMILAGGMALDFRHERARVFLDRYQQGARDGLFAGDWKNDRGQVSSDPRCLGHRHDQSVASLLIAEMGLPMTQRFARFANDVGDGEPTWLLQGM